MYIPYVNKDHVIINDLHAFTMPSGYGVEVKELGKANANFQ